MAVAQGVVKKLVTDTVTEITTKEYVFRPEDYVGEWSFQHLDRNYSTAEIDAAYGEWRKMDRTYVISPNGNS